LKRQYDHGKELHIISVEMMLWCLESMAQPVEYPRREERSTLSDEEVRVIRRVAQSPRLPHGMVKRIADYHGIPYNSFTVMVCRVRRGTQPKYWDMIKER